MRLLLFLLFPLLLQGQALSPEQIASLRSVTSVALAPDASFLAYTLSEPANPLTHNLPATTHLYVANPASGVSQPLVTDASVAGVSIRPRTQTITFLSRRPGDSGSRLYEIPSTGGTPKLLHEHPTSIQSYSWASDGSHIVYVANEPSARPASTLPYQPELFEQFVPHRKAYLQNVDMPGHTPHLLNIPGSVSLAAWSPDLMSVALSVAPTPAVDDQYMAQTIFIVSHSTKTISDTLLHRGKLSSFQFSPDSKSLVIRGAHNINDPIDARIRTVAVRNQSAPKTLLPEFLGDFEAVSWTGATTLHFIASENGETSFGTMRPDGTTFTRVLPAGGPIFSAFSASTNGTVAFVANTAAHPGEVYVLRGTTLRRLTDSNPWLKDIPMAKQEVVTYAARDGRSISGVLVRPMGEQTGKRYPLITVVHGGPEAHVSNGWVTGYNNPGQYAAARGYAVFYPNYRGSTGRGIEFAYSSQGDLAGKEFDDVVDGVDHLIRTGLVDSARVGVTGGSYGGYATAWMSTYYSNRFAAGVMSVGISNNISKWGTSDIPEELFLVHSRKRIWDYWEDNLKRSPIYYVDRSRTPLLIMHGKDDTRVHPGQSLELFRHLKVRKPNLPVELVLYQGEGHGNRNATARYDYHLRMMGWFDTHLKP